MKILLCSTSVRFTKQNNESAYEVIGLIGLKENVIVGRLIPAGTGGAARDIKKLATQRDAAILEQKKKEESALVSDDTKVGTDDIEDVKEN